MLGPVDPLGVVGIANDFAPVVKRGFDALVGRGSVAKLRDRVAADLRGAYEIDGAAKRKEIADAWSAQHTNPELGREITAWLAGGDEASLDRALELWRARLQGGGQVPLSVDEIEAVCTVTARSLRANFARVQPNEMAAIHAEAERVLHAIDAQADVTAHLTDLVDELVAERGFRETAVPGPRECATEALCALEALDAVARGKPRGLSRALDSSLAALLAAAVRHAGDAQPDSASFTQAVRETLHACGMPPRALLPEFPDHDAALQRWSDAAPARHIDTRLFLPHLRATLGRALQTGPVDGFSDGTRHLLSSVLVGASDDDAALTKTFRSVLAASLQGVRTESREAVLVRLEPTASIEAPRWPAARHIAAVRCRLPDLDGYTVGRGDLVDDLARRIVAASSARRPAVAALSGQPGVGASTVAIAAAHALASHFQQSVVYVDLHGLDAMSRRPLRAVVRLVANALGIDTSDANTDDELLAAYRDRLEARHVLIVLDNALDADHVREMVEAQSSGALIVTSRNRLQDYADPGLVTRVGRLERTDSMNLLRAFAPTTSPAGDVMDRLARLCDDLPMALRLLGARIAAWPELGAEYLAELLEDDLRRLDYLAIDDRAVRSAIRLSYNVLDEDARRLFRFMASSPRQEWTADELAHCLDEPPAGAELLLNRLADRSLAEQRIVPNRAGRPVASFVLPSLIHLFAGERLDAEEAADAVAAFRRRSVEYLADRLDEIVSAEEDGDPALELESGRQLAALQLAFEEHWSDLGIRLANTLSRVFARQRDTDAFLTTGNLLVRLHLARGEPESATRALLRDAQDLARLHKRTDLAEYRLREAGALADRHQLHHLDATAKSQLSRVLARPKHWPEALDTGIAAFHLYSAIGRKTAAGSVAINNARIAKRTSDPAMRHMWAKTGWQLVTESAEVSLKASAAFELAAAESALGNHSEAIRIWRQAVALYESDSQFSNAAIACENAAHSAVQQSRIALEREFLHRAVEHWARSDDPDAHVASLIDLSAANVRANAFGNARASLDRALAATSGSEPSMADLRAEVQIRLAAVALLTGDDTSREHDLRRGVAAQLDDMCSLIETVGLGGAAKPDGLSALRSLLAAKTACTIAAPEFWLHEALEQESTSMSSLASGTGQGEADKSVDAR